MDAYRIVRSKYASALTASGKPNRWNNDGAYVIYTSNNRALTVLEFLVHRSSIMSASKYKLLTISIPDEPGYVKSLDLATLPKAWQLLANYHVTQNIGSDWYRSKETPVLKVPSAIVKNEFNFILNTNHADYTKIKIDVVEDFEWDKRLI